MTRATSFAAAGQMSERRPSGHSKVERPPFTLARLNGLSASLCTVAHSARSGADRERDRATRRREGVFFTPAPLVDFVAAHTLAAYLAERPPEWREDGSPVLRVLDPCAGDGRFLAASADFLAREAGRRGYPADEARAAIVRRCMVGIERQPDYAEMSRQRLGPGARVVVGDALSSAIWSDALDIDEPDVVVGNPPYVRSVNMRPDERSALVGTYAASSHGEWDLYAVFLEHCFNRLAPGGHLGLVVPSRWFTGRAARALRAHLTERGAVRALLDFGAVQVFPRRYHVHLGEFLDPDAPVASRYRPAGAGRLAYGMDSRVIAWRKSVAGRGWPGAGYLHAPAHGYRTR